MQFKFQIGTKVLFGKGCVKASKLEFSKYGKRAFLVTGKNSGKESGALIDVISVLEQEGIEYIIHDKIENNPSLENVYTGGKEAREFNADFIVGIGGGSPLDASKAVAVLAVNDIDPIELYKNTFENKPLPVLAIPTTAGTGSEVTPYSILTRNDMQTKMSFGNEDTFPVVAFMDASYSESMPNEVTVNTAVDAFSHAVEGYLSRRSTAASDIFALEAIKVFGSCINNLIENRYDFEIREKLLYTAMYGGMTIAHTGTTIVHGLGYSLTYFKGLPHGKANGLLMKEYFKFNYETAKNKIENILKILKLNNIDEFGNIMDKLMKYDLKLKKEEIKQFAALAMKQRSSSYNIRSVTEEDLEGILRCSIKYGEHN